MGNGRLAKPQAPRPSSTLPDLLQRSGRQPRAISGNRIAWIALGSKEFVLPLRHPVAVEHTENDGKQQCADDDRLLGAVAAGRVQIQNVEQRYGCLERKHHQVALQRQTMSVRRPVWAHIYPEIDICRREVIITIPCQDGRERQGQQDAQQPATMKMTYHDIRQKSLETLRESKNEKCPNDREETKN